jgi:hypothetical protein
MNPYPGTCSVVMLDNCAIHKSQALRELVEAAGSVLQCLLNSTDDTDIASRLSFGLPSTIFSGFQSD